jgi:hypothetical protein
VSCLFKLGHSGVLMSHFAREFAVGRGAAQRRKLLGFYMVGLATIHRLYLCSLATARFCFNTNNDRLMPSADQPLYCLAPLNVNVL